MVGAPVSARDTIVWLHAQQRSAGRPGIKEVAMNLPLSSHQTWSPARMHDRLVAGCRWVLHAWWTSHRLAFRVMAVLLLVLFLLRLALPYALTALINHQLSRPGLVQGHVDDLSISLWRGRYAISGLHLTSLEADGVHRGPLLEVAMISCVVHVTRLFAGRYEGSLTLSQPELHLGPPAKEAAKQAGTPSAEAEWQSIIRSLVHFRIAAVAVEGGRIDYDDPKRDVHAAIGTIAGHVDDLIADAGAEHPTTFKFHGITPGQGALEIIGEARPDALPPQLEMEASLEHLDLTALSPITENYDGLHFESGVFSGYLEYHLDGTRIEGSFKPIFQHLAVSSYASKKGPLATKLFWSVVVPVAEFVLKNGEKDQQAAIVPISGQVTDPHSDTWTVIGTALRNAFIRALAPGFDGLQADSAAAPH
jgi:Domain of Unknown Function (DUF748)